VTDQFKPIPSGLFAVTLQVGAILNTDNLLTVNAIKVMMMAKVSGKFINSPGSQLNVVG